MSPVPHKVTLSRKADDSLDYTPESLKELLRRLVAKTGGYTSKDGKTVVAKDSDHSSHEHTFIPDADLLAHNFAKGGVTDPYLSGMVREDGAVTLVNPLQYTVYQPDKVETSNVADMGKALEEYGGSDPERELRPKKGLELDRPHLRELVVFKPERMALHWISILTAMYVKTEAALPGHGTDIPESDDYSRWVDNRDRDYVSKVNEIYYKLTGIDRTLDHSLQGKDTWDGKRKRRHALDDVCKQTHEQVNAAVDAFIGNGGKKAGKKESGETLTDHEQDMVKTALKNTAIRMGTQPDAAIVKDVAATWVKAEIYRERANKAVCHLVEHWFVDEVFNDKKHKHAYHRKAFVPTGWRESFVLSGGSATGKSLPMSLVCERLAQGYDKDSTVPWKREGLDLNDAVHMKSEVMRSLLLEPEFLRYGNRLFFDESAHDERRIIRDEMFKYLGEMLKKGPRDINEKLAPSGQGPVILHDRRSTYEHETQILQSDGANLHYFYFNVPAKDALQRNWGRGVADLEKMEHGNFPKTMTAFYAPRFVNARNNIRSQESSARRMMEMLDLFPGKNIVMPLYSTKVEPGSTPQIIGYANLATREIHIRRITRLIDTVDNAHLRIKQEHEHHPGPLPVGFADLTTHSKKEQKDIANAEYAAEWLAGLVKKHGYTVTISTPPVEKKTGKPNEAFVMLAPSKKNGPVLTKLDEAIYRDIQTPTTGHHRDQSRHAAFLGRLEELSTGKGASFTTQITEDKHVSSLLFSERDYVANRNPTVKGR